MDSSPCQIWLTSLSEVSAPATTDWMSLSEHSRLNDITSPARRTSFIAGHWFLRVALSSQLAGAPEQWCLEQLPSGALTARGPDGKTPGVSLSHTGNWIACAIDTTGAVGIDIEGMKVRSSLNEMVALYGSESLQTKWAKLDGSDRLTEWYRWWCCYESWVKQQQRGIDLGEFGRLSLGFLDSQGALDSESALDAYRIGSVSGSNTSVENRVCHWATIGGMAISVCREAGATGTVVCNSTNRDWIEQPVLEWVSLMLGETPGVGAGSRK